MGVSAGAVLERATAILADLVAFDTTSRRTNLEFIDYVERYIGALGVSGQRVANEDGSKANLFASFGPAVPGGIILSGHTDVVPVDGQDWSSDPFSLTRRGDRLFGRGTCDMKGFLALALAIAPDCAGGGSRRPMHIAFSYDEEVGCLGAPSMIAAMAHRVPPPAAVIVGEPTDMNVIGAHKGISSWTVTVTGHEAHSSLTHLGLSANMIAVRLMQRLTDIADELERTADPTSPFVPAHATLTIGLVAGGTAVNILARSCSFTFDLRAPAGIDPDAIVAPFLAACEAADRACRKRFPDAGVVVTRRSDTPPFAMIPGSAAEAIARQLSGDNGATGTVPYAAEAGQYQAAGFAAIICGPGSIEQAHQADEYIEVAQMARGAAFMTRLATMLAG